MAVINEVRRDDPDQTVVAEDLPCELHADQKTIVLDSWREASIQPGDIISCGELPHAVIVEEVGVAKEPDRTRRMVIKYRAPDRVV